MGAAFVLPGRWWYTHCRTMYNVTVWRTAGFLIYFWPLLYAATLLFFPALILRLLGAGHLADRLVRQTTSIWARHMLWVLGARVTIERRAALPKSQRICIVANHQSYGDSLMIQGYLGITVGFLAKRELAQIPPLSLWMRAVGTADLLERQGFLRSAAVRMVVHPPVHPESYLGTSRTMLAEMLRETVVSVLPPMQRIYTAAVQE